jgi:hypothetical protein
MPSVLAIVSKAVFEKEAKIGGKLAGVGTVVPFDKYATKNKALNPAGDPDGAIFLVTVRPPDEALWLVGILETPTFDGTQWNAGKNTVPIRDIGGIRDQIQFTSGTGISAKKGALGMSLQTPRVLADADVVLLRAGAGGAPMAGKQKGGAAAHLNAHERGGPTPCLCRKCIDKAPETVTVGDGLVFVRDRAEGGNRFLWYWMPESLKKQKEAIRRAVESQLIARARNAVKKRRPNLDKVFTEEGDDSGDDDDDDDDYEDDE